MSISPISSQSLDEALSLRDLTDGSQGAHAMQILIREIHDALVQIWSCHRIIYRSCPIVPVSDNYDALGYSREGAARDARYTRYVSQRALLRTQTSAAIPTLLRSLAVDPPEDLLLVIPGLVYRRDVIDRLHVGEPHQLDLWRIRRGPLRSCDLVEMIRIAVPQMLPDSEHRVQKAEHPYTTDGLQIDVRKGEDWVEIGECGVACPRLLERCGLNPSQISGLAMGLGLDRILMLRKGIPDIRLLRSSDRRVLKQMQDLNPYQAVSNQPAMRRDLSIAVTIDLSPEELGDQVRSVLANQVDSLESLEILNETSYDDLPDSARKRMGILPTQKNLLIRLTIRHPTRTLTSEEANRLRDQVYLKVHQGLRQELTGVSGERENRLLA